MLPYFYRGTIVAIIPTSPEKPGKRKKKMKFSRCVPHHQEERELSLPTAQDRRDRQAVGMVRPNTTATLDRSTKYTPHKAVRPGMTSNESHPHT